MRTTILSLSCLAALAGCGRSPDPIVFGHLDPKGTDDSEYRAIRLAIDETNADPAKKPFERRVHVIHATAGQTLDDIHNQATRLAAVNRVFALIGGDTAQQTERVGQAAQADSILAFTPSGWAGSPPIPSLFPVGLAPQEQGRWLAQYAADVLNVKKVVALVDEASPAHRAAAEAFVRKLDKEVAWYALPRRSGSAEKDRDSQPDVPERSALVERLRNAERDALLLAVPAKDAAEWSRRLGVSNNGKFEPLAGTVLFGGEEAELPRLREEPDLTARWIATAAIAPDEDSERFKLFADAFRKKYERDPDTAAALAYDAYQLLIQGCKKQSEAVGAKVREELRKKDAVFEVLTGKLTFADDQTARRPLYVVRLDKDGVKRLQRYDPAVESMPPPK